MINERVFRVKRNGEPNCKCFCRKPELIENYDLAIADTTQVWDCHHRREEFYSQKELKERNEYFDVQPEELIFLTPSEHRKIDSKCIRISDAQKGKTLSEEHKQNISKARKGMKHSDEEKRKVSESLINRKDLSKKVLCVETGEIFESTMDARRKTGISHVSEVCLGKRKTAGKFHWQFAN